MKAFWILAVLIGLLAGIVLTEVILPLQEWWGALAVALGAFVVGILYATAYFKYVD